MDNFITDNRQVVSRFYNQISFKGNRVIKGVPQDRFIKETEWFKEAKKRIPNNIPHLYNYNPNDDINNNKELKYYEMQAINGSNLYQWSLTNIKEFPKMFNNMIGLTKKMHREMIKPNKDDIYQMYFLKPNTALADFINKSKINNDAIIINDQQYSDPIKQLKDIYKGLENHLLNTKYSFIHGDLTMSNILVSSEGKLFLIDPRGSFGKTKYFGDVRYDIAKIYYSVVGRFDSLNTGKFNFQKKNNSTNNYVYSISDNGLGDYKKIIFEEFNEQPEIIKFIHSTIWLSLIPHTNDSDQRWCTFCNAVYLLNTINSYEN